MQKAINLIQTKLLMGGRDGIMLSTDEINQLDWSVFDDVDVTIDDTKRGNAIYLMGRQIDKLRNK